jgi:heat shock protein HtpX
MPWVHGTLAALASRAGIPTPRLYLIPEEQPNAFATGRNPAHGVVAVTRGLLTTLDPRELEGVLAHEVAHIKNRDILLSSIAAAMAAVVTYAAHAVSLAGLFGSGDGEGEDASGAGAGLLVALLAPVGAALVQMAISRSREHLADATAARLTGDPEGLAMALLRLERRAEPLERPATQATASLFIVSPLLGGLGRLFSTHPPTEDRVRRLMSMRARTPTPGRLAPEAG